MSARGRQSGFALLIVLWTVVLVFMLVLDLSASARVDTQVAHNVRGAAQGEAEADAVINREIFALLAARVERRADIPRRPASGFDDQVSVRDEGGKINPNVVGPVLMRAFLVELGAEPKEAERLADAIADWRTPGTSPLPHGAKAAQYRAAGRNYGPPGAPFQSLSELADVLGMRPAILNAMAPHLTLWSDGDPDPLIADPVLRRAINQTGLGAVDVAARNGPRVVTITGIARTPSGLTTVRHAVVRFSYTPDGRGWRVLDWGSGEG